MPESARSLQRRCIESASLLVAPPPASAWQFVNVIDSTGPYFEFTPPGINASGVVAFRARLDAGGQAIVSGDDAFDFFGRPAINDTGAVAFEGTRDGVRAWRPTA